jgi:uncharacterized protein YndB with AHSA1/START domain
MTANEAMQEPAPAGEGERRLRMNETAARQSGHVLEITRLLNAPRELVFEVWTSAEHIAHWWGPKDFTVPFSQMDARPGGNYRANIRSAEGADYWMQGVFREIEKPRRLVFTWAWEDDDGKPGHETLITLTFEAQGERTLMTFRQEVFDSVEARDSHEGGWMECFDRLVAYVETQAKVER